jgi:hypothetical protein
VVREDEMYLFVFEKGGGKGDGKLPFFFPLFFLTVDFLKKVC